MQKLLATDNMKQSVILAVVASIGSYPFLLANTKMPLFVTGMLFVVLVLVLQAANAWTPLGGKGAMWRKVGKVQPFFDCGTYALLVAIVKYRFIDPALKYCLLDYLPMTREEALVALPFSVLFESIVLTAGVYAFAIRLTKKVNIAVIAVPVCYSLLIILKYQGVFINSFFALIICIHAFYAINLSVAYHRYGLKVPVFMSLLVFCRNFLPHWL